MMRFRNSFQQAIINFALIGSLLCSAIPADTVFASQLSSRPFDSAQLQLDSLTPEEKVGQLFLITFSGIDTSSTSPIFDLISNYHVGGIILDRGNNNFQNPDSMPADCWELVENLQLIEYDTSILALDDSADDSNTTSEYIPLLIGLSQEGDRSEFSDLISGLSPIPSQMSLGATWDPSLAEQVGSQVGRELSSLGINLLFGPSLDVVSNPSYGQSDLGVRSFGGDPYWVGKFGQAYIRGIHNGSLNNIAVVAKYFPGLGSSDRLPEDEVATVRKSLEQLKQTDLAPFFAVTGNAPDSYSQADALLNSHIRYQGLQGNIRSTTRPISLDPQAFELLMDLEPLGSWRDDGGLVISDNLGSLALQQLYDPTGESYNLNRVAVDAFIAGNDILYLGNYSDEQSPIPSYEIISTLNFFALKYTEDQDFAERVDTSVLRILELKNSIYPNLDFSNVITSENTLSAIGNSDLSELVARESATLINPDPSQLDSVIQSPPSSSDRIVILSDTETTKACSNCPDIQTLSSTSLEDAIIRLYGPFSGNHLVRANITSYSFKDLTLLLDFPDEVEDMVADLYNANWIIIAALDLNENRPYSFALPRLLAERQDLLRNKTIILFAYGAPYYLDATNISKISAFFALYNKLPASLDASARILFKELPSFPGSLPVSVPGVNYDLISATSPDPDRQFQIYIGAVPDPESTSNSPDITPAAPIYHVEDIIDIHTGIILDHNGNPVPDGTPVDFIVTIRGTSSYLPTVTTVDGSASTSYLVVEGNNIVISAQSSQARSSSVEINILGDSISESNDGLSGTSSETVDQPVETISPEEALTSDSSETAQPQTSSWRDWAFSLIVIVFVSVIAYQVGATSGLVRWGIRWSLSSLIAGLFIYNYITLGLPGVDTIFPNGVSRVGLGLWILLGSCLAWLIAFLYQKFLDT
jgi:beta-N-acetylhexosaminidase